MTDTDKAPRAEVATLMSTCIEARYEIADTFLQEFRAEFPELAAKFEWARALQNLAAAQLAEAEATLNYVKEALDSVHD